MIAMSRQGPLVQHLVVFLLLSLLTVLIYSNTFSASFHFDDEQNIMTNPQIKDLSNFLDFSASRHVGLLSFALNYHFGRLDVFGYHLVNLLIHTTNGFLVYILVLLLFRTPFMRPSSSPSSIQQDTAGIAFTTALLFVADPIQTQAVTYIVQRFTSLATLFYLLSVVCYLKWRLAAPERGSRYLWYGGAWVSTILAMKTKEISFTLPFMILLVEGIFFWPLTRRQWVALIPFLLTLPIIPFAHSGAIGEAEAGWARETTDITRLDYLFTQFRVIVTYLRLLVLPIGQNLDYDYPIHHSLLEPAVLFSFLFLSLLGGLAVYLTFSSQYRLVAFGLLWFFVTLSVESSIIPIRDVIFEHRLYLPGVGLMLAASAGVVEGLRRWRMGIGIGVAVVVVIFSVATYQRNKVWKDEVSLWADVVQKSPNKARGYLNLGNAYQMLGRLEESIREYKTALRLKPNLEDAQNNLGNAYGKLGRLDEAVRAYKTALTLKPDYLDAHYNLGLIYYKQGRPSEAIMTLEKAVQIKPDFVQAHNALGGIYLVQGQWKESAQEYQIILKQYPDLVEAHYNLGIAYYQLGQLQEARHEFERTLQIKPGDEKARQALASLPKIRIPSR